MEQQNSNRECSFTPEISKNSRRLIQMRDGRRECKRVEDRLIGYLNKNRLIGNADHRQSSQTCHQQAMGSRDSIHSAKESRDAGMGHRSSNHQAINRDQSSNIANIERFSDDIDVDRLDDGDCDRDVNFSFRKVRKSVEPTQVLDGSPYRTEKHLNFGSRVDRSIEQAMADSISIDNHDRIDDLSMQADIGHRVVDRHTYRQIDDKRSKNVDVSLLMLKRSTVAGRSISGSHAAKAAAGRDGRHVSKSPGQAKVREPLSQVAQNKVQQNKSEINLASIRRSAVVDTQRLSTVQTYQESDDVKASNIYDQSVDRQSAPNIKPNRSELTERYGVKVKKASIDCSDIRESVFAGDTTSMLQNLKKLNSNLRKCGNLECIIKKRSASRTPGRTARLETGLVQQVDLGKENWRSPVQAGIKAGQRLHPATHNPFIEQASTAVRGLFN